MNAGRDRLRRRCVWILRILVVLGWLVYLLCRLHRPLLAQPIPTHPVPSPNARDFYLKALGQLRDEDVIERSYHFARRGQPPPPDADQCAAAVEDNRATLALLRRGFAYPCVEPAIRGEQAMDDAVQRWKGLRQLARLLRLEAWTHTGHEAWSGAMACHLDGLRFGLDIPHGSPIYGDREGTLLTATALADAWDCVAHLDSREARLAAARASALLDRQVPLGDVLTEEKWWLLSYLVDCISSDHWYVNLGIETTGVLAGRGPRLSPNSDYVRQGRRGALTKFAADLDGLARRSAKPAALLHWQPGEHDLVWPEMVTRYAECAAGHLDQQAQDGMLATALALQAWSLEHGRPPARLHQLVPGYLRRLPDDPFAEGQPFRYRREGAGYVLWSVGPDGKDDGGRPIDDTTKTGRARHYVMPESRGDIVAGVNP
ncbi:MAG: hypothetical protein HYU66_19805 [Armatimonadetes bacterium]|nr:hypothetical protein [Armatimonadota bacterium]